MSDDKAKTSTPTPVILDWDKAVEKLEKVTAAAMTNTGKENHNPFMWVGQNVEKLKDDLKKGKETRTEELHKSIMALPDSPDTRVDKTIPDKPVQSKPPFELKK